MTRSFRRGRYVMPLVFALLVGTGTAAIAAFVAIKTNTSTIASAADWLPPVIDSAVLGSTSGVAGEHLRNGSTYYAYANVGADRGNPASGIASVTADLSSMTSGQSAATLTAGSYTFNGVSYNYRSASLTANVKPETCLPTFPVTAKDAAAPVNSTTRSGLGPLTDKDLATDYNIRLDGPTAGDLVGGTTIETNIGGEAIAGAGDVNNDGLGDVIVGNRNADNNGTDSGSAYVIFGRTTPTGLDLGSLGSNGFRIDGGAAGDKAGYAVSGAGDVNGDDYADVLVTATSTDNAGSNSGSVYVLFGSASPTNLNLAPGLLAASAGYRIDGAGMEWQTGISVANAGDVNGDGRSDAVFGVPVMEYAYVVFGKTDGTTVDLGSIGSSSPAKGFSMGGPASSSTGGSVAGAGDVNGDGKADVLVGAPFSDIGAEVSNGSVFLVYGKDTNTSIYLPSNTNGFRVDGRQTTAMGESIAGAGDVNGDRIPDLLMGARYHIGVVGDERPSGGSVFVIFGKTNSTTVNTESLGSAGYQIRGAASGDLLTTVAGIGDVNDDGKADALMGAYGANAGFGDTIAGRSYVVFGKSDTTVLDLLTLGTKGYIVNGAAANDKSGQVVANAGDTNGDGRVDFLIGAPQADNNSRADSGSAYVVHGPKCSTPTYASTVRNTPGLISHWPLSEASGTTAYDAKGLNNGTYTNSPTLAAPGAIDGGDEAVAFDGANDYVSLGNPAPFQLKAGTIEAWVKTTSQAAGPIAILVKPGAWGLALRSGVLLAFDDGAADLSTGVNIADGAWHHVALTFQTGVTNGTKIYIDGALRLTSSMTVGTQTSALQVADNDGSQFLPGSVDEPAIYNRVLTPTEIAQHFNVANAGGCSGYAASVSCTSGLTGHWPLGEASGTTAVDVKGLNNGTYAGGATLGASGPLPGSDTAVGLDGVDDHVNLGNPAAFQVTTGTVEAWVRTTAPGAGYRGILVKGFAYGLFLVDSGFATYDWGTDTVLGTGDNLADGRWHHVAMTFESAVANGTKLYVDGRLRRTTTITVTTNMNGESLLAGANTGSQFLAGSIDEPAIYNRVLTAAEIADHYSARDECSTYRDTVQCTSGLQHYYRLGESSGTSAVDAKRAADGTYAGAPTLGSAGALVNDADSAATFGAVNTRVDLTGLNVNTTAGAYNTVEFWMYWDGSNSRVPFSFTNYNLYTWSGLFGFNTYSADMYGVNATAYQNRWVHVAAAFYNGDAKKSRLWLDGAEQTLTQHFGVTIARSATSSGSISDATYPFGGKLDEVAIYNRGLTSAEILAHYNAR